MRRPANLSDPKIAALYRDVPAADMQRFQDFLARYPYRQFTHQNATWNYIDIDPKGLPRPLGSDAVETLLLLPGALCIPEVSYQLILRFAAHFRVLCPVYPPLDTMDALADGAAALLLHTGAAGKTGATEAHVLGGSYGGFVAQIFVRRHPQLTRSLILSHSRPPVPEVAGSVRRTFGLMTLLPLPLLRLAMNRSLSRLMPPSTPETALPIAISKEMIFHSLDKADWVGLLRRSVDYFVRRFTPADLDAWPGNILLLLSDSDGSAPEVTRKTFTELYPRAVLHLFHATGHASSALAEDEYFETVMAFLGKRE